MSQYVRIATAWLTGCSGCHVALLDLGDELAQLLHVVKFVFTPIGDVREVVKADVGLIEGAVATTDDEELLARMREQCTTLVALGSCATVGGIPALRNVLTPAEVISHCYLETPGTENTGTMPVGAPPQLRELAQSVGEIVPVDIEIPGCPPTSRMIGDALAAFSRGEKPSFGTKNLCVECDRSHPNLHTPRRQFLADYAYAVEGPEEAEEAPFLVPRTQIFEETVHAVFELETIDPSLCFLEQGVLCMGPATRQGCGAACLVANYPCRGCFGPTPMMFEQGARLMDALATILPPRQLVHLEDLVGTGYRFSPPRAACGTRRTNE